ncbi:hypothetical protein [Acetobacter sp.]|jgi:hypothetical protein|uniref:hypothetical protein n=1 Tax=Acetobacter sp. TaxID=440 RepID=UPI0025BD4D62|nr:hypothetical protein [Acetobacter sp.]MCH4091059.1 hypothetical protein [Acetobacter sp.]MCI1300242.1 hypothetical protein [Acetobacter sp.]MCI1316090.1 hypothetical protein [Acetobacter sp.]
MSLAIPDWMPLWAQVLLLGLGIVVIIAFLLMPFAVYGVKGRLSEIALQLEDARADLRVLTMRVGALTPEQTATRRKPEPSAPQEEWLPPVAVAPSAPEFQPTSAPRARATGMAPSPLLPPEIVQPVPETAPRAPVTPANELSDDVPPAPTEISFSMQRERTPPSFGQTAPVRASDAYEPGPPRPPELRATRVEREIPGAPPAERSAGRMPWHNAAQPEEPIFSRQSPPPRTGDRPPADGRTEPVLRWPSRPSEQPPHSDR